MIQSTSIDDQARPNAPTNGLRTVPWIGAAGVALLGTWLLYAAIPAINWTICTLAAAAAFICSERSGGKQLPAARFGPLLLACILAGGAAITAQPFMQALILLSLGMLAATVVLLSAGLSPALLGFAGLLTAPVRAAALGLRACAGQLRSALGLARAERSMPLLRGCLLALPVGMVFFLLLSAADPTMAGWRDAARDALAALSFLPRTIFFALMMIVALGGCTLAALPPDAALTVVPARMVRGTLRDVERLLVLGAVAAVFALFLVLQVSYLFGNPGGRVGSGVSYAAAVHRGFGELTAAAALCLLLALALDHCALRGARETLVRGVTLILVAEAGLLLVSAHLRLVAYEEAYGYSLQRLYVRAHTVMTAISLALLAWEVCAGIDTGRLFRRLGLAAAIAVAVFSYWNHAAWVTAHDIGRYQRTGMVDIVYLTQELGDDAIPELIRSLPALRDPQAALARSRLEALKVAHAKEAEPHWYEWNLRRMTARRALAALPVP